MKLALKSALRRLLERVRTRSLKDFFQRPPRSFAEADLILSYFSTHSRLGFMIDVGAHFGESLAPYLQRGWSVCAFEPDPANRAELLRQIPANPRLQLHAAAVSDHHDTDVPFYSSPESHGISGLSAFRATHVETHRTELVTLSEVLTPEVSAVDYLKIDAEGHDLFVLRGFPWDRLRPEVVLCEFEDRKTRDLGYDHRALGDFLLNLEYKVYLSEWHPIERYGINHNWRTIRQYPCGLVNPSAWGNFLAFPHSLDTKLLRSYLSSIGLNHSTLL